MGASSIGEFAGGRFQPEVTHTFLPRCRACGSPHPLAVKSAVDKTRCSNPACDEPLQAPAKSVTQVGSFGFSPSILFGRALLAIGRLFASLSRGV